MRPLQFSVAGLGLKSLMEAKSSEKNMLVKAQDVVSVPLAEMHYVGPRGGVSLPRIHLTLMRFLGSLMACLIIALADRSCALASGSKVQVRQHASGWELLFDGKPFFIKGVGCEEATGKNGEDYLLMAKEMGANTVRTYSTPPRAYLDKAQAYGLKVDVGIWFDPVLSESEESYQDPAQRARLMQESLAHVRALKDHPALLAWNVGNEVIAATERKQERAAFGQFLEELIQRIHREDPDHPTIYSSASSEDLPDLQAHVPSLDIMGINIAGHFVDTFQDVQASGYDKPVLVTEFAPLGPWDAPKSEHGVATDSFDHVKAADYVSSWRDIQAARPATLGGFAYVLGEQRNFASLTWFNINLADLRREPYWAVYTLYTGRPPVHRCPRISDFRMEPSTALPAGAPFTVTVKASSPDGDPLRYSYFVTDITESSAVQTPTFYPVDPQETSLGSARLKAPNDPGVYRVYVSVTDAHKNTAIANLSFRVRRMLRKPYGRRQGS